MPTLDKPFTRSVRNRERIHLKVVRDILDTRFEEAHDELSESYYGKPVANGGSGMIQGWRHGVSAPWQGFDHLGNAELSKQLFDRLQGLIGHHYRVQFHQTNQDLPPAQRIPIDRYEIIWDPNPNGGRTNSGRRRSIEAQALIDDEAARGVTITIPPTQTQAGRRNVRAL